MERILIIEDEKDVNELLAQTLMESGYRTVSAFDGIDGLKKFENGSYDMVLLDLMLPYKSGDEILKRIRMNSEIPIIIISAKDMVGTKIDLLTLGADDYITKPFDLGEVTARVVSNLRRSTKKEDKLPISYKDMVLDTSEKTVHVKDEYIELTATEYQMMELFLGHPGKVFSKANLYETVWQDEYMGEEGIIKTHISNLRSKLKKAGGEEYIETVWGLGYRLKK